MNWTTAAGEGMLAGPVWIHLAVMTLALAVLVYNLAGERR